MLYKKLLLPCLSFLLMAFTPFQVISKDQESISPKEHQFQATFSSIKKQIRRLCKHYPLPLALLAAISLLIGVLLLSYYCAILPFFTNKKNHISSSNNNEKRKIVIDKNILVKIKAQRTEEEESTTYKKFSIDSKSIFSTKETIEKELKKKILQQIKKNNKVKIKKILVKALPKEISDNNNYIEIIAEIQNMAPSNKFNQLTFHKDQFEKMQASFSQKKDIKIEIEINIDIYVPVSVHYFSLESKKNVEKATIYVNGAYTLKTEDFKKQLKEAIPDSYKKESFTLKSFNYTSEINRKKNESLYLLQSNQLKIGKNRSSSFNVMQNLQTINIEAICMRKDKEIVTPTQIQLRIIDASSKSKQEKELTKINYTSEINQKKILEELKNTAIEKCTAFISSNADKKRSYRIDRLLIKWPNKNQESQYLNTGNTLEQMTLPTNARLDRSYKKNKNPLPIKLYIIPYTAAKVTYRLEEKNIEEQVIIKLPLANTLSSEETNKRLFRSIPQRLKQFGSLCKQELSCCYITNKKNNSKEKDKSFAHFLENNKAPIKIQINLNIAIKISITYAINIKNIKKETLIFASNNTLKTIYKHIYKKAKSKIEKNNLNAVPVIKNSDQKKIHTWLYYDTLLADYPTINKKTNSLELSVTYVPYQSLNTIIFKQKKNSSNDDLKFQVKTNHQNVFIKNLIKTFKLRKSLSTINKITDRVGNSIIDSEMNLTLTQYAKKYLVREKIIFTLDTY